MGRTVAMLTLAALCGLPAAAADASPGAAKVLDGTVSNVEKEIVALAEAMPAGKFSFAPSQGEFKGVRTFALQIKHVATVNYMVAGALLQEKPPVDIGHGENGPDGMTGKDEIVNYLKGSFAYVHKALAGITEGNLNDMMQAPFGSQKMPRLSMAMVPAWHTFDHYGQMVVYARMNGIVPPSSR